MRRWQCGKAGAGVLLSPHPALRVDHRVLGLEGAPLLVIDDVVSDPDRLVRKAGRIGFTMQGSHFPGLREPAPFAYQHFLGQLLPPLLQQYLGMRASRFSFPLCHYSLVTLPPQRLGFLQRVPHIDSVSAAGLATVHYLFRGDWGGTDFYRHRATGFEVVDASRKAEYFQCLARQGQGADAPGPGYIDDDTVLFERIARVEGVYNRMAVYRRNSLHSGSIDNARIPPAHPLAGRLSINSFIDVVD